MKSELNSKILTFLMVKKNELDFKIIMWIKTIENQLKLRNKLKNLNSLNG